MIDKHRRNCLPNSFIFLDLGFYDYLFVLADYSLFCSITYKIVIDDGNCVQLTVYFGTKGPRNTMTNQITFVVKRAKKEKKNTESAKKEFAVIIQ